MIKEFLSIMHILMYLLYSSMRNRLLWPVWGFVWWLYGFKPFTTQLSYQAARAWYLHCSASPVQCYGLCASMALCL